MILRFFIKILMFYGVSSYFLCPYFSVSLMCRIFSKEGATLSTGNFLHPGITEET